MMRSVRARFTGGMLQPLESLALEEGEEVVVTLEEQVHASEEAEVAALARAMDEAMTTERVSEQEVFAILRNQDGD